MGKICGWLGARRSVRTNMYHCLIEGKANAKTLVFCQVLEKRLADLKNAGIKAGIYRPFPNPDRAERLALI